MKNRFECVLDPCNRYTIWDNRHILPVLHHGRLLSFTTLRRAQKITAILNDVVGFHPSPQPPTRRPTAPRDGGSGTSHAQHAMRQHNPDGTTGSRLAHSLLCQQLVRRYRPNTADLFLANIGTGRGQSRV
jgi:hypothetical protein